MREIKCPAIYKHFKNKYYATMGVSEPISFKDIERFCKENEVRAIKLLKFEARQTEFDSYKGVHIFELNGKWHHMSEERPDTLVLYKSLYDNTGVYTRDLDMFLSKVDKEKYPYIEQEYKFELIG